MREDDYDSTNAGLYIGPILLAVFLAGGAYRTICESRSFVSPIDGTPFAPVFAAFTIYLAFKVSTYLERAAWLAFAATFIVGAAVWILSVRAPSWAGWLFGLSAILFTAAGLRQSTRSKVAMAAVLFVLVFIGSFLAQRYGFKLAGRSTVFAASRICA